MDWHLLFPMSCVSSSTWDEELLQVLSCPVIQFQLLQVQKAEIEHLPLTSDPSGQEIKGKEGSYQIISRDNATQTETSHSDRFFSAVRRPSAGLLCGTVQKDSWESCWLWGIKEAFAKEGNLLLDEESLFNVNMSNHLHGCGIQSSASWGVWRERWQIHWAIVSNWMQHLGKVPCMKTGATQLGVGQSKAEDRLTSACTRDCTEALGQAAEGNAWGTIPGGI